MNHFIISETTYNHRKHLPLFKSQHNSLLSPTKNDASEADPGLSVVLNEMESNKAILVNKNY